MYPLTDLDLVPIQRTQANYWQARYFEAYKELVNANKGLRRLRRKLDKSGESIGLIQKGSGEMVNMKSIKMKSPVQLQEIEKKLDKIIALLTHIHELEKEGKIKPDPPDTRPPCGEDKTCSGCSEHGECKWVK